MTSCLPCTCFSSAKRQHERAEPNAFDLTWSNYILSTYFCSCTPILFRKKQPIRLEDDDDDDELFLGPDYYNQHYQGRAVRGYLDNTRDWEFDSVLYHEQQDSSSVPHFVTRNPFGRGKRKRKKHRKRQNDILYEDVVPEDAEYLDDDQIANLAYRIDQDGDADQYGEETYIDSPQYAPAIQEIQKTPPPPPSSQLQQKEFYAERTMPSFVLEEHEQQQPDQQEQQSSVLPEAAAEPDPAYTAAAAQNLLSERLENLTDKLAYIKKNIMDINRTPSDNEMDKATLHTLKTLPNENQSDSRTDSDIGSVGSQALDEYESTSAAAAPAHYQHDQEEDDRIRRHSGVSQFRIPFGAGELPPFGSDRHPFSYFTDRSAAIPEDNDDDQLSTISSKYSDTPGFNLQGVLNFGKRWFGA